MDIVDYRMIDDLKIPYVNADHFGVVPAPQNFLQFTALLNLVSKRCVAPVIWRGQTTIQWRVHSRATRAVLSQAATMLNLQSSELEKLVQQAEMQLLQHSRKSRQDFLNGRQLADLEMFALLQHNGERTRLLEFNKNAYIGLWFACRNNSDGVGFVIGSSIDRRDGAIVRLTDEEDIALPLPILFEKYPSKLFAWDPIYFLERMRSQQLVYLFGPTVKGIWGSLQSTPMNQEDMSSFFVFAIPPSLKEEMQNKWLTIFGYDISTMFPEVTNKTQISRYLEFAPEHYQAGISILNYFGTVLREKHADLDTKVRIEQDGLKVTLIIESSSGEREEIEKTLNDYGLVVTGRMTPEEFYESNPLKALELKQQLQIAKLQLETQQQMLLLSTTYHEQRISSLENEIRWLRTHVGEVLIHANTTHIEHITGDLVNNDKVSVGNVTDSANIAVGKHNEIDLHTMTGAS